MPHSRRFKSVLGAAPLLFVVACGPGKKYTNEDIPKLPKLADVMWSQAQAADPQFKKIGKATYSDDDYRQFTELSARLALTTSRIKADFSKGPEFNQFADTLAMHAQELGAAASSKDAAATSKALGEMKATCKACHAKFK